MGETHFALGRHWYDHFHKQVQGQVTVGKLRAALDAPSPMGLPAAAQNLVIQLYADQANRSFYLHGGPYRPRLENLPDELELREQALPSQEVWEEALYRAAKIFGISVSPLRNATNVSDLATKLAEAAGPAVESCQAVRDRLEGLCADWGIETQSSARYRTATAVLGLVRSLAAAADASRVEALTNAAVETSLDAMGTSFTKAGVVRRAIEDTRWALFQGVAALSDDRAAAAKGILSQLTEVLQHDEYAIALQSRLSKLEGDAIRLLTPVTPPPPPPPPPPSDGVEVVEAAAHQGLLARDAGPLLAELKKKLESDGTLKLDLSWKLFREKDG